MSVTNSVHCSTYSIYLQSGAEYTVLELRLRVPGQSGKVVQRNSYICTRMYILTKDLYLQNVGQYLE